jgi:hypothetical protein
MHGITISQDQLNNAKLYSNRWTWIKTIPEGLNILEVGVSAGDYSNRILERNPNILVLLDTFLDGDITHDHVNSPRFQKGENLEFIIKRFEGKNILPVVGRSQSILPEMNKHFDEKFDIIYLDASSQYENLKLDIKNSLPLLKDSGILALNDYMLNDRHGNTYGVVPAVTEFLDENPSWEVIGFALDKEMFCDIHLRKSSF